MGDLVDTVINIAAGFTKKKAQKKNNKKTKKKKDENLTSGNESKTSDVLSEIEAGKMSSLLKSQISDRKTERRAGVLATNEIEKDLVRETITVMRMKEAFHELNL